MNCPSCDAEVLDIDVKCPKCGVALGASGAHRMLGSMVLGQYELVDILGQGGMSVVFKGRHKMTDQEVALKILPPELAAHAQVKSRFLEEAKALAALDHPNIVHLYNFGQENGCFVLAMQFVQGDTWERMILGSKRLDWRVSVRITIDVLRALEYAHNRGIVHRDMKPSNVLVRKDDQSATVMDFGIAKMTTSTRLTATGQTMGTVRYMSPEQVRGLEVDARTDIYSLGATLYESLTGDTPFDGQTHFEIMTKHLGEAPKRPTALASPVEVPVGVEDALMRSLAKRTDDRFQTARDMRLALEGALRAADLGLVETQRVSRDDLESVIPPSRTTQRPPTATPLTNTTGIAEALEPASGRQRTVQPTGRRGTPWVAVIAVFVVVGGGGGAAAWYLATHRTEEPAKPLDPPPPPPFEVVIGQGVGINVDADQVKQAYEASLARVRDYLVDEHKLSIDILRPLDRILVTDARGLCDPSNYDDGIGVPPGCDSDLEALARAVPRTLLVVGHKDTLAAAMDHGVIQAVGTFETYAAKGETGSAATAKVSDAVQANLQRMVKELDQTDDKPDAPKRPPTPTAPKH